MSSLSVPASYLPILTGRFIRHCAYPARTYHCEPAWRWHTGPQPDFVLWCVLSGRGSFEFEDGVGRIDAGTCLVIPPGFRCRASHDPQSPLVVFAVHFDIEGLAEPPARTMRAKVTDVPLLSMLADRCVRACSPGGSARLRDSLLAQAMLLIADAAEGLGEKVPGDERIAELTAAIERAPGDHWTVPEMASRACLSPSQLTRRMRAAAGAAPREYVLAARLQRARELLSESNMTVSEIAETLGFESPAYFSRLFARRIGLSPTAYRDRGARKLRQLAPHGPGRNMERPVPSQRVGVQCDPGR